MKIDLPSSFGPLHTNITSLNLDIDDLKLILSRLNFKIDIIGICKHKIRKDTPPSSNISINQSIGILFTQIYINSIQNKLDSIYLS